MPDNEYSDYERLYSQVSSEKLVELDCIGLHLNSPEPAIICKQCGYAITADKDRVSRHLGEVHNVDKAARRGLNKLIRLLNLPDPKSLRLRPDGSAPHPYLKKLTGASSCRHCGLRSASHDVLQSHLRHTHPAEIELARKSGRHWLRDHIKTGLTLQSWTAQGVHKSWIIGIEGVQTSEKQLNANILLQETPDAIRDFAQQLLSEEQERLESRLSRKDLVQDTTKANLMTNWMRRTGWEHLLKDARRDILVAMSNLPVLTGRPLRLEMHAGESLLSSVTVEQRLALIVDATDRLFDRCGDTIRSTDVCVRRWLRSRLPDYPYNTAFELVSKSSSERVYRKELKRCLCFWLRLLQFPPRTVKVILGKSLRRSQRQELTRLWEDPAWSVDQDTLLTDASIPCDESVADESSDEDQDEDEGQRSEDDCTEWSREETLDYSDGYSSTRNSPTPHITTPADPAADLVLRLAYYMTTEDFADGRSSSTMLVFFSAVRGLSDPDGEQYLRPHRFTPILSRLIYCIRLIFIEAILPQLEHPYVNIASRPRHDQLQILNAARRENMCDGTMSSMGEFLSLLDYGRALSRSEGPVYHFYWSEDGQTLSWDGQTYLTMTQFRGLAHEALLQASAHCKRLMYDWDPDYLDLAHVRDRLSNTTNGYSFVSDPANKLEDAYLELFMRACISPVDGLLQKRGKDQSSWDVKAARAYLNAHDDLLRCLMALFQFDWGQACRISELLTLECYNTTSRLRGICVYGAKLCAITRSHKARLTTNDEFQVARFFSPAVSRLVYQYLVYIRPTAHALLRKCFHATPHGVLLFTPTQVLLLETHCVSYF